MNRIQQIRKTIYWALHHSNPTIFDFEWEVTIPILSWLLHHANRFTKSPNFYAVKSRLLKRYGRLLQYEVQYIEGKECWSCGGTGIHHWSYDQYGMKDEPFMCWSCYGSGWYKDPMWVILKRILFGKYIFHQPYERSYSKPQLSVSINGYVTHTPTKHGLFALNILYLLYDRKAFKLRIDMWYWNNVTGPIKKRQSRRRLQRRLKQREKQRVQQPDPEPELEDDLPF